MLQLCWVFCLVLFFSCGGGSGEMGGKEIVELLSALGSHRQMCIFECNRF